MSTAAHPGYTRTNLQTAGRNLTRGPDHQLTPSRFTVVPSQGVETGAEPMLYAATSPTARPGAYYGPRGLGMVGRSHRARIPRAARSPRLTERTWSIAETLTDTRAPGAAAG